jgi:methylmalonyl-CoA mutase
MIRNPRASALPPVTLEEWRAAAEAGLKGRPFAKLVTTTHERIDIQPLYVAASRSEAADPGLPGAPPYRRGTVPVRHGWRVCQEHTLAEPRASAEAVRADVDGGGSAVWLRCDRAVRLGGAADAVAGDGLVATGVADLLTVLEGVDLESIPVTVEAGASAVAAAASLVAAANARGVDGETLSGAVVFDPMATLASEGELPSGVAGSYRQLAEMCSWGAANVPNLRLLTVDLTPYHEAGANAVQELALALATGVEGLRRLSAHGVDVDTASRQLLLVVPVGRDLFMEIAKLRALRTLWAEVERQCGIERAPRIAVHARTGRYDLTQRDPWVNLLRGTTTAFASVIGGADSVAVAPYDSVIGLPDRFSQHLATNTQHLLAEEAHLGQVTDAAGGSWYVERLTDELAEATWKLFQEIEAAGGMAAELLSGGVAERIDAVHAGRLRAVARRRDAITGVSEFPNVREEPVPVRAADVEGLRLALSASEETPAIRLPDGSLVERFEGMIAAAANGASWRSIVAAACAGDEPAVLAAFPARRAAQPFEALRDACDRQAEILGARPKVFLASWGPIPQHRARAEFAGNFFEAGGFEADTNDGFSSVDAAVEAFTASEARVVVVCSSDEAYPEVVQELAPRLKAEGARWVLLAGRPGDHEESWRQSGVDRFIFLGCDALETLETILRDLEVVR